MITLKDGNIFDSKLKTLVNPINCVGVMGKGLSLAFKQKYPKMFINYQKFCSKNLIKIGILYPYSINNEVRVINFSTKKHWRYKSKLEYIDKGLKYFIDNYKRLNITSIAFPPLGCGSGGLDFNLVYDLMKSYLNDLEIEIEIYKPLEETSLFDLFFCN